MARPPYEFELRLSPAEREERLHREIKRLRTDLVSLAPMELQGLLWGYDRFEDRSSSLDWAEDVAERIAAGTTPLFNTVNMFNPAGRANCPLCGGWATNFNGEPGFKLPEGLRRHLVGYGRIQQCVVMRAAADLARDHFHEKFYAAEQAAQRATFKAAPRRRR